MSGAPRAGCAGRRATPAPHSSCRPRPGIWESGHPEHERPQRHRGRAVQGALDFGLASSASARADRLPSLDRMRALHEISSTCPERRPTAHELWRPRAFSLKRPGDAPRRTSFASRSLERSPPSSVGCRAFKQSRNRWARDPFNSAPPRFHPQSPDGRTLPSRRISDIRLPHRSKAHRLWILTSPAARHRSNPPNP